MNNKIRVGSRRWLGAIVGFGILAGLGPVHATLIGHWDFNEGSGTTALDSSGNGNNGTIHGATYVAGPPVMSGTALSFNGTSAYVDVGNALAGSILSLNGTSYTVAWWADLTAHSFRDRMINKDDGNDYTGGYSFYSSPGGTLGRAHNNGTPNIVEADATALPLSVWMHLAVVYDISAGQRYIYKNAVLVATDPITGGGLVGAADPVWFGAMPVYGQYFNGALDDIRMYNTALSAAEIIGVMVPEPSTALLLGVGGLLLFHRRSASYGGQGRRRTDQRTMNGIVRL